MHKRMIVGIVSILMVAVVAMPFISVSNSISASVLEQEICVGNGYAIIPESAVSAISINGGRMKRMVAPGLPITPDANQETLIVELTNGSQFFIWGGVETGLYMVKGAAHLSNAKGVFALNDKCCALLYGYDTTLESLTDTKFIVVLKEPTRAMDKTFVIKDTEKMEPVLLAEPLHKDMYGKYVILPDRDKTDMILAIVINMPGGHHTAHDQHPQLHSFYVLQGSMLVDFIDAQHEVKQGDVLWTAPYTPHLFTSENGAELFMFKG